MEIWKPIITEYEDYTGLYEVSNKGRIKALPKLAGSVQRKEKILKNQTDKGGYEYVILKKNKNNRHYKVHRLVAMMFIPNEENKKFVDHINTIRNDNRVENLRWVTKTENANNPLTKEKVSKANKGENNAMYGLRGEKNPNYGRKFTEEHKQKIREKRSKPCMCIETGEVFQSVKEANRIKGITTIGSCCKDKYKTAGGYHWKYV